MDEGFADCHVYAQYIKNPSRSLWVHKDFMPTDAVMSANSTKQFDTITPFDQPVHSSMDLM